MKISYHENPINAEGEKINHILNSLNKKTKIMLLLSGGSQLEVLQHINWKLLSMRDALIIALDERFTADKEQSNSLKIEQFLDGIENKVTYLSLFPETDDKKLYERQIQKKISKYLTEIVNGSRVCIATFGIGLDGHTAGLFPIEDILIKEIISFKWKVARENFICYTLLSDVYAPTRCSFTYRFIKKYISYGFSFINSVEKMEVYKSNFINRNNKSLLSTPCLIWKKIQNFEVFISKEFQTF